MKLPPVGERIIKSAFAVALCYLLELLRGEDGIVFYSQLSALWCIQSYVSTTIKNALQRTTGTCLGALTALIVLLILEYINNFSLIGNTFLYFINASIISLAIIPLIWITVLLKKKDSSYFSCVVFLSIVVVHISDTNSYYFVWNRFLDTMIGIFTGCCVNTFHLPRKSRKDILFVSGLDNTLLNKEYHLNDYCRVELNRMLDQGLNFTLSTLRTPASIIEPMAGIRLKLPVIAMDGAVLYDTVNKRYIHKICIQNDVKNELIDFFDRKKITYFTNIVIDDTLLIYHNDFTYNVQEEIVKSLRLSPHRNYIHRPVPLEEEVVYFMLVYPEEEAEIIYRELKKLGYCDRLKVLYYDSTDYPHCSYIKIFNLKVTREGMIDKLKNEVEASRVITFGTVKDRYDYVFKEGDTNSVVKKIKVLFE